MKKSPGFSLIELLVVISTITVLSTIGAVVYTGALKNNRDQQRLRNFHTIKQALEFYRSDLGYYPSTADFIVPSAGQLASSSKVYLTEIPADPVQSRYYKYVPFNAAGDPCVDANAKCARFVLCAKQEGSGILPSAAGCSTVNCGDSLRCDKGISSD